MSLPTGTRIGIYEVVATIGAGGMGEVYRARDTRLNRDVALKILPDTFAADSGRVARFRREAQLLATLNHANIAQIYGFEEVATPTQPSATSGALVLELVEGPTLADRLANGPLPLEEATAIARQIADALETAHECGIVHRDLKPANVKVKGDGTVKVLDFGLAKAFDPTAVTSADAVNSPTLSLQATQAGVVLGTAAYMAPEQAKGRSVDRRADIWAFGVVLYEMLSGRRLFEGDDVSETLAAVLRQPVEWSSLPADTPAALRLLLARCLDRDPRKRLRDIGEARVALEAPSATLVGVGVPPADAAPTTVGPRRSTARRMLALTATAIVAAALAASAVWMLKPTPVAGVVRFQYTLPAELTFAPLARHFLNISPDGAQVVYGTNRGLFVRRLSEQVPQPLPETVEAGTIVSPVFSPDGRTLAFWADGTIKRVPADGGPVLTLCAADNPYGLTWGETGIVFAQAEKAAIMRVSPNGGTPEVIARVRRGELVGGPELLPGGRFVLFSVTSASDSGTDRWDRARIAVQALGSDEQRTIVEGGSDARYLPTRHLVYAAGGILFAAPFDAARAELEGPAVPVLSGVRRANPGVGNAHYAVSRTGTIVYLPGPAAATAASDFALIDRQGTVTPLDLPLGAYRYPRVSPNGRQLAFTVVSAQDEFIALFELTGGKAMRRLTLEGRNRFPVWLSDLRIAYQSDREGDGAIFWQPADGSGAAERLTKPGSGESHAPESWSPTTNTLLFSVQKESEHTLWALSLPDKSVTPVAGVRSTIPINAVSSPDGRWMAYQSDQSGRATVYVQPVPPTGAVYQLLPRGADVPHEPMWSPSGKELFYNPRAGGFEAVAVTTQPEFGFGIPVALPRPFLLTPPQGRRSYDVAPDGRFVALVAPEASDDSAGAQRLDVVVNWHEELKRKVPTGRR